MTAQEPRGALPGTQSERLRLAAAASGVAVLLTASAAAAGYFPVAPAVYYGIAVLVLLAGFFVMFRPG